MAANTSKTITTTQLTEAMNIVKQEAKRAARSGSSDTYEELVAEGNMRIMDAFRIFDETKGPWGAHVRVYVRVYSQRGSAKAKSVVPGNASRRTPSLDVSIDSHTNSDGEAAPLDFAHDASCADDALDARGQLATIYGRWTQLMAKMTESQKTIASKLIESQFDCDMSELADECGVSRPTVYKVQNLLRSAAAEAVGE